jgi:hypothetical protein
MNTITRRTALAVPVTLPLLPVAALAMPTENDPVVVAFTEWKALDAEVKRMNGVYGKLEDRFGPMAKEVENYRDTTMSQTYGRRGEVEGRISQMVPTSVAGMAAQLRIVVGL